LWFFFKIACAVVIIYYIGRLIGLIRRRVLWRLSRRLVVTYLFIAFVPIVLILALVAMGAVILNGQFAAFLVNGRLGDHFDELKQLNRVVAHEAAHIPTRDPAQQLDALEAFYRDDLSEYASSYPDLQITLRADGEARAFTLTGAPLSPPIAEPSWLKAEEWAGIVTSRDEISLRAVDRESTPAGPLTLILSMPVTPELLNMIGDGIGPVGIIRLESSTRRRGRGPSREISRGPAIQSSGVPLPPRRTWIDFRVRGVSALHPVEWNAETLRARNTPVLVVANSRIFPLNEQLLRILGKFADTLVLAFLAVAGVFLIIEIVALIIGIRLTRSITSTVNRLQSATEAVKAGDFSHRIALPARDQVSALGEAFDEMTASLERLIAESNEKLRLENELRIAQQVQQQLFPQRAPELPGARLFGECRAARGVSGDLFDFQSLGRGQAGLVLGDVSGKGIYAALLMAGIQSAVRAQFYDGWLPEDESAPSTATVLSRLNRQIYDHTPDAKYATFFYAIYDSQARTLCYTNAGHPAPFLFRRDTVVRLETGGTVLGLFPRVQYEQGHVALQPGDLLLAFTDGLVEPENAYGEQFGEQRLAEAVREAVDAPPEVLAEGLYRAVAEWTGRAELEDDMTLLYMKVVGGGGGSHAAGVFRDASGAR
ncbi:MAG: PP2C family protein-serine/threonine phosphatase, partial [Terriglobia bacterium]